MYVHCMFQLLFHFFVQNVCTCTCVFVDADDVDKIALVKVFTILQQNDPRDGIIYVAATGDVPTLKKSLEKHPEEVGDIHNIHVHVLYMFMYTILIVCIYMCVIEAIGNSPCLLLSLCSVVLMHVIVHAYHIILLL